MISVMTRSRFSRIGLYVQREVGIHEITPGGKTGPKIPLRELLLFKRSCSLLCVGQQLSSLMDLLHYIFKCKL